MKQSDYSTARNEEAKKQMARSDLHNHLGAERYTEQSNKLRAKIESGLITSFYQFLEFVERADVDGYPAEVWARDVGLKEEAFTDRRVDIDYEQK